MGKKKLKISDVRKFIEIDGTVYEILTKKIHGMQKGFAYVDGDFVYIYEGKKKTGNGYKPGHVYKRKGDLLFIKPTTPELEEIHSVDRIECFSNSAIINKINDNENFKVIDQELLESADNYFAPPINEDDDVFKRTIKRALEIKKIPLGSIRDKFPKEYDVTNMKSALVKSSPMSNRYFHRWAEALGLHLTIKCELTDSCGDYQTFDELLR